MHGWSRRDGLWGAVGGGTSVAAEGGEDLADVHVVDEVVVGVEVDGRLGLEPGFVEGCLVHFAAFDDHRGFGVVGGAVLGVAGGEAEGGGLVAVASAPGAHVFQHLGVVEGHDGEVVALLHVMVGVAAFVDVDRHCGHAPEGAELAPADGHGVAAVGGAGAEEHAGAAQAAEGVLVKLGQHVEGMQLARGGVACRVVAAAAGGHHRGYRHGSQISHYVFHAVAG